MEQFFDGFSKTLAGAVSRRSLLGVASRSLFTAFVTSGPIGKLWASDDRNMDMDHECLKCDRCLRCDSKSGQCDECRDPLTAARLYARARRHEPYRTLQSFIAGQFSSENATEALLWVDGEHTRTSVLSTSYSGVDPGVDAKLYFAESKSGYSAYAFTFSDKTPQFGYFLAPDGTLQQVLPPYSLLKTNSAPDAHANLTSAAFPAVQTGTDSTACLDWCYALCALVTYSNPDPCLETVLAGCEEFGLATLQPEVALACYLVGSALCYLVPGGLCAGLCNAATSNGTGGVCGIQPQQPCVDILCPACQKCSASGQCVPMTCPPGYSCNSVTRTCTCNNICGGKCCPTGQECIQNACTGCPTGQIACGSTCCPSGESCVNGACSGVCSPNPCPSGEDCCVAFNNGPLCYSPGNYCCSGGHAVCPVGTTCCGATSYGSFMNQCCTTGEFCYAVSGIGAVCCAQGEIGCSVLGIGEPWCCQSGTSCGTVFGGCV